MSSVRKFFALAVILALLILLLRHKSQKVVNYLSKTTISTPPVEEPIKTILYYKGMWRHPSFYMGALGNKIFQNCRYSNCFVTNNKTYLPIEQFDALVFHGYDYSISEHGKPRRRSPHQIYIFGNLESPAYTFPVYKKLNNFYNWTMTYRRDSDVFRPYGSVERKTTNYQMPTMEDIQKRKKKIAWFVSNCNASSKRSDIVEKLKEHIPVDVYGRCGTLKCARNYPSPTCYKMAEKKYKFYLSFENSICQDYVTEKVFQTLQFDMIPIVYGWVNYIEFTPPNSVIDVRDFFNINELVAYLNFLDSNPDEYLKYFEWKKNYIVHETMESCACSLCEKLNLPIEEKTYPDIGEWWEGAYGEKCSTSFVDHFLET